MRDLDIFWDIPNAVFHILLKSSIQNPGVALQKEESNN